MGRQLPIVATPTDERELLAFIATLSPIRIYVPFAKTIDSLWIGDWAQHDIGGCGFDIWPTSFAWEPEYKQTGGPRFPKKHAGFWYISNDSAAPIIEVSRPPANRVDGGRIYWARDLSAPNGLTYDAVAFSKVVDRIWNWIRRNGRRQEMSGKLHGPYFLPGAWNQIAQVNERTRSRPCPGNEL